VTDNFCSLNTTTTRRGILNSHPWLPLLAGKNRVLPHRFLISHRPKRSPQPPQFAHRNPTLNSQASCTLAEIRAGKGVVVVKTRGKVALGVVAVGLIVVGTVMFAAAQGVAHMTSRSPSTMMGTQKAPGTHMPTGTGCAVGNSQCTSGGKCTGPNSTGSCSMSMGRSTCPGSQIGGTGGMMGGMMGQMMP